MKNNETILVAADSSADCKRLDGIDFRFVPLKIRTAKCEYVDDETLDLYKMTEDLQTTKERSSTSCPNTQDWMDAFGDHDRILCFTITSALSGSCNSALAAAKIYMETHPPSKVCVIDSKSTGPEIALLLEKTREMILSGLEYDEICRKIEDYKNDHTRLLYVLESMRNLANNGRVNPIAARLAGILGIRIIGKASDKGTLELLEKFRGSSKTAETVLRHMQKMGYDGGKVNVTHCLNETAANAVADAVRSAYAGAEIKVYSTAGLCGYYAEKGGLLIGFEV